jgi:hypothetical protein
VHDLLERAARGKILDGIVGIEEAISVRSAVEVAASPASPLRP